MKAERVAASISFKSANWLIGGAGAPTSLSSKLMDEGSGKFSASTADKSESSCRSFGVKTS